MQAEKITYDCLYTAYLIILLVYLVFRHCREVRQIGYNRKILHTTIRHSVVGCYFLVCVLLDQLSFITHFTLNLAHQKNRIPTLHPHNQ